MFKCKALSIAIAMALPALTQAASPESCADRADSNSARACLIQAGYPYAQLYRDDAGQVLVAEKPTKIVGDFSEYVTDISDISSPLLARALENSGKNLNVTMSSVNPKTGDFTAKLIATVDGSSSNNGALVLSNLGPDLSGRDILSWYNRSKLGNGYVFTNAFTHGFSDLRPESHGGKYETAFLEIEKATKFGLFDASYTYSVSESGGDAKLYELGGITERFSLNHTVWPIDKIAIKNGIEHTERKQDFGVFDIGDKQRYSSLTPGVTYDNNYAIVSASIKKGVSGHEDFDVAPLMGSFNPHYWSATVDLNTKKIPITLPGTQKSLLLSSSIKGFAGSDDMPSSERLGLGGQGAGSSHESGLYSGYKGYQYRLAVSHQLPSMAGINSELGFNLNGSKITTAYDEVIVLDSFESKASFAYKDILVEIAHAFSVQTKNINDDERVTAKLVWRY